MKTTITVLISFGFIGGSFAQVEKPDETAKAAAAITRITKSDEHVKWFMSDGRTLPDVKILRMDGPWAEIEYFELAPRVVTPKTAPPSVSPEEASEKATRKRLWVNINHVLRIITSEQAEKESK